MNIEYSFSDKIEESEIVDLYEANGWSSAKKPIELLAALRNSHSLLTARLGSEIVGLGNALSDGYLVVYYPHLIILPRHQRKGIGSEIMKRMKEKYGHLHQQILVADGGALEFYEAMGFIRSGQTQPMWIYHGDEH